MSRKECRGRRSCTGLAAVVLLACGVGAYGQVSNVKIVNIETGSPVTGATVELVPEAALVNIPTFYSLQAHQSGQVATGAASEAFVYREEFPGGPTFGLFVNYQPSTGAFFPGAVAMDDLGLGGGFPVGGTISSYTSLLFRSSLDPNPGELGDFHLELWDGDPFLSMDTVGGGFSGTPIAGSGVDFVDVPQAFIATFASGQLPKGVTVPAANVERRVWMVLTGSQTGNRSICRLGWIIGQTTPLIGNTAGRNLFGLQTDDDALAAGNPVDGGCCTDGTLCNASTGPICPGDPTGSRGFCTDDFAESAGFFAFSGTCTGASDDFCSNFTVSIFSPAESTITLQPVGNEPDGTLNAGSSIVDNEILLDAGGQKVMMEIRIGDWDNLDTVCTGGTNAGGACTSDADCPDELDGAGQVISDGGCGTLLRAYQANIDSSGYTSGLQGTLTPHLESCATRADCANPMGGHCSVTGDFCTGTFGTGPFENCPLQDPPFNEVCDAGATCDFTVQDQAGTFCSPGFIDKDRGDPDGFMFPDPLLAVDLTTKNYRYGAASAGDSVSDPDPFPAGGLYGGTLALDVSSNAKGTFTVNMIPPGVGGSGALDQNNGDIPLLGLVPGKVTITVGKCCSDIAGAGDCTENLTQAECEALPGGVDNLLFPGDDCSTPCIECLSDAECDDGDACTTESCGADGFCVRSNVTVPAGTCCNAATGLSGSNVDGDVCTDDICDAPGSCGLQGSLGAACGNPANPANTASCDDGNPCTTADVCDGVNSQANGGCGGTDINDPANGFTCPTGDPVADGCPAGTTGCSNGFCECKLDVPLILTGPSACVEPGTKVTVDVSMGPAPGVINGAQINIDYDPSCFVFNSISPGGDPYTFEILEEVDTASGSIFYAVGIDPFNPASVGTNGDARLAVISFTKLGDCNTCTTCGGPGINPRASKLTDANGELVNWTFNPNDGAVPCASVDDCDVVTIACPPDVTTNADCDFPSAIVTWSAATASSDCGNAVDVQCSATGVSPNDPNTGGEHAIGTTNYSCTGTSSSGASATCGWSVTVNDAQTVDVTVQLSPPMAGTVSRCIEFELFSDCVTPPFLMSKEMVFGGLFDLVGHFTEPIKLPVGNFGCITARDRLHSLRACDFPVCGADGSYTAVFKGDPVFGGNWLTQGNLDGNVAGGSKDVIDILDFGQYIANRGTTANPDSTCPTADGDTNADINGDGVVDDFDFAYVSLNFGVSSKDCCCGAAGSTLGDRDPVTSISVEALRQRGLADLIVADLNNDGFVNTDDISAYLSGSVPTNRPKV
ncbi:MAG: cohesin domain-containing protein, partial [Phycisphaerae bacterium]